MDGWLSPYLARGRGFYISVQTRCLHSEKCWCRQPSRVPSAGNRCRLRAAWLCTESPRLESVPDSQRGVTSSPVSFPGQVVPCPRLGCKS